MFIPKRAFFEPQALDYPLGQKILKQLKETHIPITITGSHNRVTGIPGKTSDEAYREGKKTLVVGVRKSKTFQTCKPSAHYQLPLTTSCPGQCEYCYLQTTLGKKPYLRIYVNTDDILAKALEYINERKPEVTYFEGAATSDPIPTEGYTGALAKTIAFFGQEPYGRFRFVTKFTEIDSLLNLPHNNHTTIRFSLNSASVIEKFEHHTPSLDKRIVTAQKIAAADYPLGFIIGPIFIYDQWRLEYGALLEKLHDRLQNTPPKNLSFEFISHRFTKRAKENILAVFPDTQLPLNETERQFKFGQFGYGKYVYRKEEMNEIKTFFTEKINTLFPLANIDYII